MYGLDLFSGIGGMYLGLQEYVKPLAYCEIDAYCQSVLLDRQRENLLPKVPIWDDIRTLHMPPNIFDIIYGGFPCQDISIAGKGSGLAGERSKLFFEIIRLAKETQPFFIFLENVPAITNRGGIEVIKEITKLGYDCRWCIISAQKYVDQVRKRWFLLAKSNCERCKKRTFATIQQERSSVFNEKFSNYKLQNMECWASYARSVRKNQRIPYKVDRIKALGNSVVPDQVKEAFEMLIGL